MAATWAIRSGEADEANPMFRQATLALGSKTFALSTLATCTDRDAVKRALAAACPQFGSVLLGRYASVLFAFGHVAAEGDLVLWLPKTEVIHLGRIAGGYRYHAEAYSGGKHYPHQRDVTWLRRDVDRDALAEDLRNALGDTRAFWEIEKPTAVAAVKALAARR